MADPVIPDERRLCQPRRIGLLPRGRDAGPSSHPSGIHYMAKNDSNDTAPSVQAVSEENLLKLSKEIAVKFIEVGRITPASFPEDFKRIHAAIRAGMNKDKA